MKEAAGGAAVREETVRAMLAQKLEPKTLETFIQAVRYRGGLFEERAEFFQFIHLTFQEFLAARLLAKQRAAGRQTLAGHLTESWWREVLLLTYGYLLMDYPPAAAEYLDWLSNLDGQDAVRLAGAELAGAAVLELERPDPSVRRRQADRLVALLADKRLSVSGPLRAAAGRTLGRLGDPRPGVGLRPDGLPDIAWCDVPAGEFIMGNTKQTDDMAYDDEAPQHTEQIRDPYRISKYPITNAQFDAFVQDGGYTDKWRACWTAAGWAWKGDRHRAGQVRRRLRPAQPPGGDGHLVRGARVLQLAGQEVGHDRLLADRSAMGAGGARHRWPPLSLGR